MSEDINIGQITEALNNKLDRDGMNAGNPASVVVETYQNGASWYRVYSDGWCEQGGFVGNITPNVWTFVTLLKPYINTNYTVIGSGVDPSISGSTPDEFFAYRSPLQTTGFYGGIRYLSGGTTYADRGFTWQACGYIS